MRDGGPINALRRILCAAKAEREDLQCKLAAASAACGPFPFFATVSNGLEAVAAQEVDELLNINDSSVWTSTGRLWFSLPVGCDPRPLRSVERLFVNVGSFATPPTLDDFQRDCEKLDWRRAHYSVVRFLPAARPIRVRVSSGD